MKNFDTTNFLLLNSSLKGLDKKKRTAFSLLGATSGGGLKGALPAIALGKAAAAKAKSGDADKRLTELETEFVVMKTAAQDLYNKVGEALDEFNANATKAAIVKKTQTAADLLGVKPVTDADGKVILPGAKLVDPTESASKFTKSEISELSQDFAKALGEALRNPTNETD